MVLKLIKVLVGLVCIGVFVWAGATVPLGERTLFGHLRAIGSTKESQDLVRGTKEKVTEVSHRIKGDDKPVAPIAPPQEKLTNGDRKEMKKLLDRVATKN